MRGIDNKPYIDLDPFLDIEGFQQLHLEICRGMATAREYAKEGTWMKPGFTFEDMSYIPNWKPIYQAFEEYQSLPDDDPITHYEKIFKRSVYFWEDRSSLDSLGVLSTDLYTKRMIDYQFDEPRTQKLLQLLSNEKAIKKIFIEPHLKNRMYLNSSKIRYHGCQAVRHDDHIHVEL